VEEVFWEEEKKCTQRDCEEEWDQPVACHLCI
jgi:hypothetical protein